jgi:hypothetical protein
MGLSYQLDMPRERVTSVFSTGDAPVVDHKLDPDEELLVALGYRQDFKRKFTVWSSCCHPLQQRLLTPLGMTKISTSVDPKVCWDWRNRMGMDYCKCDDPIRSCINGRALF